MSVVGRMASIFVGGSRDSTGSASSGDQQQQQRIRPFMLGMLGEERDTGVTGNAGFYNDIALSSMGAQNEFLKNGIRETNNF